MISAYKNMERKTRRRIHGPSLQAGFELDRVTSSDGNDVGHQCGAVEEANFSPIATPQSLLRRRKHKALSRKKKIFTISITR
jgi:hypothetical protein